MQKSTSYANRSIFGYVKSGTVVFLEEALKAGQHDLVKFGDRIRVFGKVCELNLASSECIIEDKGTRLLVNLSLVEPFHGLVGEYTTFIGFLQYCESLKRPYLRAFVYQILKNIDYELLTKLVLHKRLAFL